MRDAAVTPKSQLAFGGHHMLRSVAAAIAACQFNFYVRRDPASGGLTISSEAAPPLSCDLAQWVEKAGQLEVAAERLLE